VHDEVWEFEAQFDESLRDRLRDISPGDVVTVVATDGGAVTGRVLAVGCDVVTIGETPDPYGRGRLDVIRVHDIALRAVVRVVREVGR
jgi:hypothetical protein